MTWTPDHPGGRIHCDHPGCTASRLNYCAPSERNEWQSVYETPLYGPFFDYCPQHRKDQS